MSKWTECDACDERTTNPYETLSWLKLTVGEEELDICSWECLLMVASRNQSDPDPDPEPTAANPRRIQLHRLES